MRKFFLGAFVPGFIIHFDARVKSLKPRCACTGVVLRLSDPPNMNIKVERQLHDMRILDRVLCASGTRLAPTEVATEM